MKIMVTGATGFVGQALSKSLKKRHQVVTVVRNSENGGSNDLVVPDIGENTNWDGLLEGTEVIVHLAARAHVMKDRSGDPLAEYLAVNFHGTKKLAEAASAQGVKKFIFFSSIKVHGEGRDGAPYSAHDVPNPSDPYGVSKAKAEALLLKISEESGMQVVIVRPPAIYGVGVKGNIPKFAKLVKTRIPLPFGLVENSRSMVSIRNLEKWVERAVEDELSLQTIVIAGDPRPVSTRNLVDWMGEGMGIRVIQIPIPVSILNILARLVKRQSISQRLLGNLVAEPSFDVFPEIKSQLNDPRTELVDFGRDFIQKS